MVLQLSLPCLNIFKNIFLFLKYHFVEKSSRSKCNISAPMEPAVLSFIPF